MRNDVDKFVVGYLGRGNDVYGEDEAGKACFVQPFPSLRMAREYLTTMGTPRRATVYKLVAVKMPAKRRQGETH